MTTQGRYLPTLTAAPAQAEQHKGATRQTGESILRDEPLVRELGLVLRSIMSLKKLTDTNQTESLANAVANHLQSQQRSVYPAKENDGLPSSVLEQVLTYIHANLEHSLTLVELAEVVNISPCHFTRLFKRSTGQSVHQYIVQQRIETAKRLIHEGQLSLGEISLRAGFFDQSHLYRHFKRHVGTTPAVFAELCKNVQ